MKIYKHNKESRENTQIKYIATNRKTFVNRLFKTIEDLVFPRRLYCICCESFIDENNRYGLCKSCFARILWNSENICNICGKALKFHKVDRRCQGCKEDFFYFRKGLSATTYGLLERRIISEFKNRKKTHIGREIAQILFDRVKGIKEFEDFDVISYPPASKKNFIERGFNQSQIVSRFFYKKILQSKPESLVKHRELFHLIENKKDMKRLSKYERIENIQNKIRIKEYNIDIIKEKKILLIDDVFTTGATLNECSRVLIKGGASEVLVLTFATGW